MIQLVDKYRPKKLADFVGVDRPRAILQAFARKPYTSAWLLLGPSGLGKTTMALALADEIGGQIHHIPAAKCTVDNINETARACWNRPLVGDFNIVVTDEADRMSTQARYSLLSILDVTAMPPDTIFLFTANSVETLREAGQGGEGRFLSRVRTVKFTTDKILEPAAALLARIWKAEGGGKHAPDFRVMLRDAELNLRSAIMTLEIELMGVETDAQPAPESQRVLTAREYAGQLGINVATLYKRMQDGKLPQPVTKKPLTWRIAA